MNQFNFSLKTICLLSALYFLAVSATYAQGDVDKLVVLETQYSIDSVGKDTNLSTLAALIKVKNNALSEASSITVEAKFTNSQGKVIEVITENNYGVTLASGKDVTLKLRDQTSIKKEDIAKLEARVVSADFRVLRSNASENKTKNSSLIDFLINWGPMLLFIGVWIWLMRRYSKGYQEDVLKSMKLQNEILERQAISIEAIANHVNKNAE